ncbi:uncharacterized protein K460DRAFT_405199 [Cucurbitaria berberidis CBS 394.84]|uniref:Uncharacterized protein n=1 Tax=Cucurbitaria berberidis CBS 394.84 TaxID=1168544 RepID=A0A9P4GG99_9PLEO|nr:uncharacterized protein K460DRAFT_405199 [Cucurbitaria berberidis CBS 394.84]KAF1844921.1 hypothetical protein K460DRAFT_405199 [Cucurbitaria berberidis CBS 394.84]
MNTYSDDELIWIVIDYGSSQGKRTIGPYTNSCDYRQAVRKQLLALCDAETDTKVSEESYAWLNDELSCGIEELDGKRVTKEGGLTLFIVKVHTEKNEPVALAIKNTTGTALLKLFLVRDRYFSAHFRNVKEPEKVPLAKLIEPHNTSNGLVFPFGGTMKTAMTDEAAGRILGDLQKEWSPDRCFEDIENVAGEWIGRVTSKGGAFIGLVCVTQIFVTEHERKVVPYEQSRLDSFNQALLTIRDKIYDTVTGAAPSDNK